MFTKDMPSVTEQLDVTMTPIEEWVEMHKSIFVA